mmetsp:Transcript_23204/g.22721  ORF Transcript_23204/g.22721 Transcript_23204/m.22721 type:complete len:102 (+) Transcript_23204:377-682(+)
MLTATDQQESDLLPMWTDLIATGINDPSITAADLMLIYDSSTDKYNSESMMRTMWKYCTSSQTFGTPVAFLNGVQVQDWPASTDEWMTLIQTTYDQQYQPA